MLALLPYVEKAILVASLTSSGYGRRLSAQESSFFWIIMGLGIASYLLIITGLGLYLAREYELPVALLVTGLVILFTILFALAVTRIYKKIQSRKMEQNLRSVTDEVSKVISGVGNGVGEAFRDNAGLVALVVAGLGFLAARQKFN